MSQVEKINAFLKTRARNHLIVDQSNFLDIEYADVGAKISRRLEKIENLNKAGLKVNDILEDIMVQTKSLWNNKFEYVGLRNLGILLEPQLGLNFQSFLSSHSQNKALFIHWQGEYESGKLYFQSKNKGIEVKIEDISHITI